MLAQTGIDELRTLDGRQIPLQQPIALGDWTRPILKDGKAILLVEEVNEHGQSEWRVLAKEIIKQLSQ
ncbi:MAG: hypothetical protein M1281_07555, partial [Chloroflexi bacterium]|nr:hypothetical protein [Chloroflexota bacterium]